VHCFNSTDEIDRLVTEIAAFAGKEES